MRLMKYPTKIFLLFPIIILFMQINIKTSFAGYSDNDIKILPPDEGIYHTAFSQIWSKSEIVQKEEVTYFQNLVGKNIVWLNFNNEWFNGIKFPLESVKNIYSQGVVPSIRIMPRASYNSNDKTYTLQKILDGKFDKELTQWANDAKNCGIPLLLSFAPEPNGNWFPWCGEFNGAGSKNKYGDSDFQDGPEKWRDAFIYVIELFKERGARNVTWVFHVNSANSPEDNWNQIKHYYPGDEYIDWLGLSIYGPQRWGEPYVRFIDILAKGYQDLAELSVEKPIAVLEFGVADYLPNVNKAVWVQSALYTVMLPEYNRIKAVGWWHSTWWNTDGTISALQIDSSPESLIAYKEGIAFSNFLGTLKK